MKIPRPPSTAIDDRCDTCGECGVSTRHVTRSFGEGANLLIIEAIPMATCPNCATSYFTAMTLHEVERIKALRKSVAVAREIPVARFNGPASAPDKSG